MPLDFHISRWLKCELLIPHTLDNEENETNPQTSELCMTIFSERINNILGSDSQETLSSFRPLSASYWQSCAKIVRNEESPLVWSDFGLFDCGQDSRATIDMVDANLWGTVVLRYGKILVDYDRLYHLSTITWIEKVGGS